MDGCNPFAKPGYLEHDPYPIWRPFDETCEPPRLFAHLLSSLPTASAGPVANFRSTGVATQARQELERVIQNRTVLLVGDTIDRSMVQNLCTMLGLSSVSVTADHAFGDSLKNVESTTTPGDTLLADYCYVEQYDTLFTSFYHYGIETSEVWNKQPTYYPPQRFEARVEELLGPYLQALSDPRTSTSLPPRRKGIDLAVFSSGLWDLATWAMEDVQMGVASSQDLTSQRMKNWRSRTVDMLSSLRSKVGKARIAWRSIPYPAAGAHGSVRSLLSSIKASFKPTDESNERPFVYANRVSQLNSARAASLSLQGADNVRGTLGQVWTPSSHPTIGDIPLAEMTFGQETSGPHSVFGTTLNPDAMLFWDAVLLELKIAVA
ncbi:hypothetical protein MPSI1_000931 [Malassezia psittaci]|uniref:Uncharacterized protein n=1 Tax=Malassezia psittaci TaxID=1821823 RepID=A0AAF0F913_9BASI|nr:hypothetical protein MPSI1_000931 [Malassezia psittaci]